MTDNTLFWDKKITNDEVRNILKEDSDPRFIEFAALLLSRVSDPKQVFNKYINKVMFCRNWRKIKNKMRENKWSDNKIVYWDAIYNVAIQDVDKDELKVNRNIPIKEDTKAIGSKIKEVRRGAGLTQGELAEKAKLSQQTISLIENGYTNISLKSLKKITNALGLEMRVEQKNSDQSSSDTYTNIP